MNEVTSLLLRLHLTRGRLVAVSAAALLVMGLGLALAIDGSGITATRDLVAQAGVPLLVPVIAVVFATSVLGDPIEDGTIGFLLQSPRPRRELAISALAATSVPVVPMAAVPLAVVMALGGGMGRPALGILVAAGLGAMAYASVFTALGVRFRRALVVGLVYVTVWEGLVASVSATLGRLSLRSYVVSLQAAVEGQRPPAAGVTGTAAAVVLVTVIVVGVLLSTTWLDRTEHQSSAERG